MRWRLGWKEGEDEGDARPLARDLGLHPLVARILARRGLSSPEAARAFLEPGLGELPDPFLFRDMERAVQRIVRAVEEGEPVVAYGDYDVDGVSSAAQLVSFLRAVGARADWYVPHRLREGYGLNAEALERLRGQGAGLVVALDCGIGAVAEVDRAAALGLDVVVVDHHRPSPELPRAVAVLNPLQPDCAFPEKRLAAAGVTFFLLMALRRRLRERGRFGPARPEPNLRAFLDLVALGTVADVVPLLGVNRRLVREGLVELDRTRRPGIRALCDVAGLDPQLPLTAGQVGFRLAPRLNAAGRLDDAGLSVRLLLAEEWGDAVRLARELDRENEQRRALEASLTAEAMAQAEGRLASASPPKALVLSGEGWHPGVVGIVASRVVERTGRPALLLGLEGELARGSGRSLAGFDLHAAVAEAGDLLDRFGGHRMAVGLQLPRSKLPALRARLEAAAAERLSDELLGPSCHVDLPIDAAEIDERLAGDLGRLAPFGAGNPEPVFAAFGVRGKARLLAAKAEGAEPHLKVELGGRLTGIGFGLGRSLDLFSGPVDAAFHVALDEWRGRRQLQLRLRSVRAALR